MPTCSNSHSSHEVDLQRPAHSDSDTALAGEPIGSEQSEFVHVRWEPAGSVKVIGAHTSCSEETGPLSQ